MAFLVLVSTSEVNTLYNISVSGVQISGLLMSLDCNSMRLVSPAFRVTFFLKVCKSFPSGANSSFLASKVYGSGFTLVHDWYNHHRTCECGENLRVSGVQISGLLMSLDCNSMRLVSPAFRVTFFLKVCKSFPSGANSSFLASKVYGSGFTLVHDWYNHHRTCECGENLLESSSMTK